MKRLINIIMLWRSLPCLVAYWKLPDSVKEIINRDLVANGFDAGWYELHNALLHNGNFRRVFCLRIRSSIPQLLYFCARVCYKLPSGLEIDSTTGAIGGDFKYVMGIP